MIIAAVLFLLGFLIGWLCGIVSALCLSSAVILILSLLTFLVFAEIDLLHVLLLFSYLLAHQAGYLLGAYLGAEPDEYNF
ncbi:hypothetical protein ACRAWG_11750 [Methylobacterium sp. P31]